MKVQTPQERLVKNIALGHCEIDPEYRMQDERQHQQYNSVSSDAGSEVVWVREWFERSRFPSYFLQPFPLSLVETLLVDPFVITKLGFWLLRSLTLASTFNQQKRMAAKSNTYIFI